MNENTKNIVGAIVIVACLGFIGFLVHEKVDGSYVLALSVAPIVIAYFTRAPDKKDPPAAAGIVVIAAIGSLCAAILGGCVSGAQQEAIARDRYKKEQLDCVKQYDTRAEIDACRAHVRAEWGITETVSKDAGADR